MQATQLTGNTLEKVEVLNKALLRAAVQLGVSQRELARILGVHESTISRMHSGKKLLTEEETPKTWELALLFLRMVRSLDSLFGGDEAACAKWFRANNHYLGDAPKERITTIEGLLDVITYLDAMRGKI